VVGRVVACECCGRRYINFRTEAPNADEHCDDGYHSINHWLTLLQLSCRAAQPTFCKCAVCIEPSRYSVILHLMDRLRFLSANTTSYSFRRKTLYVQLRPRLGEVLRKLAEQNESSTIDFAETRRGRARWVNALNTKGYNSSTISAAHLPSQPP
jgi:hypothetical protein